MAVDLLLLNKAATIERCVARAREEYAKDPRTFGDDATRLDAAVLNIQRACEAAIDMAQAIARREKLGLPQTARDAFALLAQAGWIETPLSEAMQKMIGYRNIAVHDYQRLQLPVTVSIIEHHLDDFLAFGRAVLTRKAR